MKVFENKVVLVTGSSRGIGRETALEFARQGADVIVNYFRKASLANEVVEEIRGMGRHSIAVRADVGDREAVRAMFDVARSEFASHLDVLVSNAAVAAFPALEDITEKSFDFTMHANVSAILWCVQGALPLMKGRQGSIITVSSAGVYKHLQNAALYTVAKNAVEALTEYLAFEFMQSGRDVTVKCVRPGFVATDALETLKNKVEGFSEAVEEWEDFGGSVTAPEDVAKTIVLLARPEMRFVHGSVVDIAEGMHFI